MQANSIKKILIVDDDPDIVESLELVLEDEGYDVSTKTQLNVEEYSNGVKKSQLPDLILLDIFLAGKDGRVYAKQLKQLPNTKNIPIIMISAHPFALHTAKDHGADDVLAKPFNIDNLLEKVKKNIQKDLN